MNSKVVHSIDQSPFYNEKFEVEKDFFPSVSPSESKRFPPKLMLTRHNTIPNCEIIPIRRGQIQIVLRLLHILIPRVKSFNLLICPIVKLCLKIRVCLVSLIHLLISETYLNLVNHHQTQFVGRRI